ncbi:response regulator receiver domain [Arthrobacter sp. AL12]|uniref:response regulator receiver domain n=1 Tax=Arthrobacter sp. AL12 TaxID=3042241 RepID=UPI00249AEF4B|nr:response regulator receiver domain [Arthrobacter sp. AL12]MDI3213221.1 response regulator receiver domain [Arthrobacter sp. AL12]
MTVDKDSVTARFLQSAVILDDEAYDPFDFDDGIVEAASLGGEGLEELAEALEEENTEFAGSDSGVPDDVLEVAAPPRALFTEAVVEGFADFGIACAALKPVAPGSTKKDHERLRALARRSDIVILDWQLSGPGALPISDGLGEADRTSLPFLRELLEDDKDQGSRFRLVCIYTGDPGIQRILHRVRDLVAKNWDYPPAVDEKDMSLVAGPLKIVLVAKKRVGVAHELKSVIAAELPALMVEEFERFVSKGLFPEIALSALSAVRDGAHHLLRRFESDLDPALMSHFYRTGSDATTDFIQGLLTDEFRSVMSAPNSQDLLSADAMDKRVSKRLNELGPSYHLATTRNGATAEKLDLTLQQVQQVLSGSIGTGKLQIPPTGRKVDPFSLTSVLLPSRAWEELRKESLLIDQRLSILSCMERTPTTVGIDLPPVLQLGAVIVSEELVAGSSPDEWRKHQKFWLCLQPLCDSVRLDRSTAFPLFPLNQNHSQATDIILEYDEAILGLTTFGVKFNQLHLPYFAPHEQAKTVNARKSRESNKDRWVFLDASGIRYEWVGQVRQWKAQKLASGVASSASRIGLDEYEFLRKLGSTVEL